MLYHENNLCSECGSENTQESVRCTRCGVRLPWADEATRRYREQAEAGFSAPAPVVAPPVVAPVVQPDFEEVLRRQNPPQIVREPMAAASPVLRNDRSFCDACGTRVAYENAQFCMGCGATLRRRSERSRVAAGLLGIFLGSLGVHRFYLGYTAIGILQIVLSFMTFGLAGIWGFVEGILLLSGSMNQDANGRSLRD